MSTSDKGESNRTGWIIGAVVCLGVLGVFVAICLGLAYAVTTAMWQMQRQVAETLESVREEQMAAERLAQEERQKRREEEERGEKLAQSFLDHLGAGRFAEAHAMGSQEFRRDHKIADLEKLLADWPALRGGMKPGDQTIMDPSDQGPYFRYHFVAKQTSETEPAMEAEIVVRKEDDALKIDRAAFFRP